MAPPRRKDGAVLVSVNSPFFSTDKSSLVRGLHTPIRSLHMVLSLPMSLTPGAFLGSLMTGIALHYKKIVKNEYYGYPQEWFPSVSATIGLSARQLFLFPGDWYPERNVFQVLIAICSGPRFALIFLWYLLTYRRGNALPKIVTAVGLFRTLLCGGWVYVTSTDDHGFHDIFMIGYLLCTLPWTLGVISLSPLNPRALKYRKIIAGCFFGSLVPLIY